MPPFLGRARIRPGEACHLTWINVDGERNVVTLNNPEKGSNSRIFKLSSKLVAILNSLPKESDRVFPQTRKSITSNLCQIRTRIAAKLQNPRLLNISPKTFRHWKATMEYHKTKDILHVMRLRGHGNINNTLKYTQLINTDDDEFASKVAKTVEEACALVESGYEYVTEFPEEGIKIFRKRK